MLDLFFLNILLQSPSLRFTLYNIKSLDLSYTVLTHLLVQSMVLSIPHPVGACYVD